MIIHGNKQISEIVYARKSSEGGGAVRLTNIIRGAQVVFGGLMPLFAWLEKATKAAILAAFGHTDGWQVIKATNAYLNGIAATDPTKASALEGFINEDPMLVCSLGLQPQGVQMPIRYIENSGAAYINTEIKLHSLSDSLYAKYIRNNTGGGYFVLSTDSAKYSNRNMHSGVYYWRTGYNINTNSAPESVAVSGQAPTGVVIESFVSKDNRYLKQDGVTKASNTGTYSTDFITPNNLWIFNPTNGFNGRIIGVVVEGTHAMHWIPGKHNGVNGMYDIEGMVWKSNANTSGSFTIEYTLPDGTPWTPLNQTP